MKVHDMSYATDQGHARIQTEQRGGTNATCDPHQKNAGGMTNQALAELSEGQSLAAGDRVRMSSRGRARHPKYGDREGFIVSKGSPSSWRVKFDERKSIQSIHRDYLEKVDSADHSWQADCGFGDLDKARPQSYGTPG
ncbi:hypothetical protein [Afipia sp. DC4300-2b1]|uniref:hypothetical protein n=1 Tax=Afipia sp. DC4300-2b1 TaxID=2804672 RepID=UPI003CF7E2B1